MNEYIADLMFELSHYKLDEELKPSYFNAQDICDEYCLSIKEVMDIAKENGYKVYKFNEKYLDKPLVIISTPEISRESILEELKNYASIYFMEESTNDSFSLNESEDQKIVSAKHLANIFDTNGNHIETRVFRSRNDLDKYIERYDIYDMTSSKDVVEYKGKTFYGNVYKVIVILPKEVKESKDVNKEYETLQMQLEQELKNARKRGATPRELRDIQREYRDKMNALSKKESFNEDVEKHDELIYKVAEKLKNNINSFEDELITLSQVEGVDVEEIKQREPIKIAKALVEEGIVDFRMFEDIEKHSILIDKPNGNGVFDILKNANYNVRKDTSKPVLRYIINYNNKDYEVTNYGWDGDNFFVDLDKSLIDEDIEKHDTLNPKLFDGEELRPEVKETIQKIADEFLKELNNDGIKFTLKDIVLLGSNVSYNYTKDSDLDIHLIADSSGLECPDDLYPLLYSAYRSMFNKNYDITIKGIPAEIYVEMDEAQAKSNGIYSLNNGWIKHPEQTTIPDLDKEAFDKLFKEWEDKYFSLIERVNEELSDDIYDFIEDLYDLRKESIASEGEYGLGNLVFKEFRNLGYLDNLKELRKQEKGKELSLEHLEEDVLQEYNVGSNKFKSRNTWHGGAGLASNIEKEESDNYKLANKKLKEMYDFISNAQTNKLYTNEDVNIIDEVRFWQQGPKVEVDIKYIDKNINIRRNWVKENASRLIKELKNEFKDKGYVYYLDGHTLTILYEIKESLDEELKKNNASKLFKLINAEPNKLYVILSSDTDGREIKDKVAYDNAKKEIEKGIKVEGMWFNPETKKAEPQPNSYIVQCDETKAKELAKALIQQEFITVKFKDENNFVSSLYRYENNVYNNIESSDEVVFDDEAKKLPYYSVLDTTAFSLGLYGNNFNLDE